MLALLHLVGFGPHTDTLIPFDANGDTTLTGHSMSGKSTCIEATCWALWECGSDGKPLRSEQLRDGAGGLLVELTTGKGATLWRRRTQGGSTTRGMTAPDGTETKLSSADAMAGKLGPIGAYRDIGRCIVAPLQWMSMASTDLGRPLRDLVQSVLPAGDLAGMVGAMMSEAGQVYQPADPLNEAGALALQTSANSKRDQLRGRLAAATERVTALSAGTAAVPDAAELAESEAVIAAEMEWAAWDRRTQADAQAIARHEAAVAAHAAAVAAREAHRARVAELGPRPTMDAAGKQAHDQRVVKAGAADIAARRALAADEATVQRCDGDVSRAEAAVQRAKQGGHDTTCPTCGRDGWTGARDHVAEAQDALTVAKGQRTEAEQAVVAARADVERCARESAEVQAAGATYATQATAIAVWEGQLRGIGTEPSVPVAPVAPKAAESPKPAAPRPDAEAHRHAQSIRDEARAAKSAAASHAADLAAANKAVADTTKAIADADAECKRVVVLVDAVRRAPTEIARQQVEALGDTGPLTLRFPPKETRYTPEIEVLIDGRPWQLASRGRLVYADALLRCALRRCAATTLSPAFARLPVYIDDVLAWSGAWDGVESPAVYLVTQPDQELVSSAAAQGAA